MDTEIKIVGDQVAYVAALQYLNRVKKPVSPHELAITLGKSRVTAHSVLKRLLQNGWVIKEGTSPKATYRAVDPFAKSRPVIDPPALQDPHSIEAFVSWCKEHGYHVPETALEYQHYLSLKKRGQSSQKDTI